MNRDEIMHRLFRAAADAEPTAAEMPFGFDTRVLAAARSAPASGGIALLARRIALIALAVIALAGIGTYRASISDSDAMSEYAMADNAIQNNLGE